MRLSTRIGRDWFSPKDGNPSAYLAWAGAMTSILGQLPAVSGADYQRFAVFNMTPETFKAKATDLEGTPGKNERRSWGKKRKKRRRKGDDDRPGDKKMGLASLNLLVFPISPRLIIFANQAPFSILIFIVPPANM